MFAHKHFALHALLDLFAFELLQDGGICHTHDKAEPPVESCCGL